LQLASRCGMFIRIVLPGARARRIGLR
jgi:hypothetical protein